MKKKMYLIAMMMIAMLSFGMTSCSSDDSNDDDSLIPAGTYVEENGDERELFTLVIRGNNIHWICTSYGKVIHEEDYTYTIKGHEIIVRYDNYETETAYYNRNGKRITIGEITYIKQ